MVGAGYTEREVCDGQGLSSPGRWSQEDRLYPSSSLWLQIQRMIFHTAETMTSSWHGFVRGTQDRRELPFDFRLFLILLSAAGYPEVKMCEFAFGVRVGPGTKLPRCTHHRSLQREQQEVDEQLSGTLITRRFIPSNNQVLDVLRDQAKRGQVLVLSQQVAKKRFPGLALLKNFSETNSCTQESDQESDGHREKPMQRKTG